MHNAYLDRRMQEAAMANINIQEQEKSNTFSNSSVSAGHLQPGYTGHRVQFSLGMSSLEKKTVKPPPSAHYFGLKKIFLLFGSK